MATDLRPFRRHVHRSSGRYLPWVSPTDLRQRVPRGSSAARLGPGGRVDLDPAVPGPSEACRMCRLVVPVVRPPRITSPPPSRPCSCFRARRPSETASASASARRGSRPPRPAASRADTASGGRTRAHVDGPSGEPHPYQFPCARRRLSRLRLDAPRDRGLRGLPGRTGPLPPPTIQVMVDPARLPVDQPRTRPCSGARAHAQPPRGTRREPDRRRRPVLPDQRWSVPSTSVLVLPAIQIVPSSSQLT